VAVSRTIARYLVTEVAQYTALGLVIATPVVLIPSVFDRAGEFLGAGITLADQFEFARCIVPLVIGYALPIAFLFGLMMAIGRLDGDREVTAMRASGLGSAALIVPIGLLGAIISAVTAYFIIDLEPRCKRELVALSLRLASTGSLIEEGRFHSFGDRMIFVEKRGADRRLEGVMISDSSSQERSFRVFAEAGAFSFDPKSGMLRLSLENGDLRIEPAPISAFEDYRISFSRFDYDFPARQFGAASLQYRIDELALGELRDAIRRIEAGDRGEDLPYRNPLIYSTQIQRMVAIPFSPLLFALVGGSLGLRGVVRSRSRGTLMALGLLGGYYGLFAYAQEVARDGALAPYLAIWAPNAILLVVGVALQFDARKLR
jgi:lipopolysaccharide export system permease protein